MGEKKHLDNTYIDKRDGKLYHVLENFGIILT